MKCGGDSRLLGDSGQVAQTVAVDTAPGNLDQDYYWNSLLVKIGQSLLTPDSGFALVDFWIQC